MGAAASLENRSLFSQRDVTIDRWKLQIGTTTWPLEKLDKLERLEPPFGLPPKHFMIGGAITLLLAFVVGGFFGFIFFCAGVGANVWWFLTQRTYGLVIINDAGAKIAGKWTGSDASEFVNEVMRKVEDTKWRVEVRRKMLSAKRPFASFGPVIEARLEKLRACDRRIDFEEPGKFTAFAEATLDTINDDRDLTIEMVRLAGAYVTELVEIATEKLIEERHIATDDGAGDGHVAPSLEAQRVYEPSLDLIRSDDDDMKLEGVKLVAAVSPSAEKNVLPQVNAQLVELRQLLRAQPENAEVRERLAIGLFNAMVSCKSEMQLSTRAVLLDELRELSRTFPEDVAVQDALARGLGQTAKDAAEEKRPDLRDALLDEMRELSRAHAGDPRLRKWLAFGLFQAMIDAKIENRLENRNALLDELRQLFSKYSQEPVVREQFAKGLTSYMFDAVDEEQRHLLSGSLDELRQLSRTHPMDSDLRRQLALGLLNTILEAKDIRDASLEELRELCRNNPQQSELRADLAHGLFAAMDHAGNEKRLEARDALLDELRQFARSHPQDVVLRERYATGLKQNVVFLDEQGELEIRDAILDELRQLARTHRADEEVRERLGAGLLYTSKAERQRGDGEKMGELMVELRDLGNMPPENKAVVEMFDLAFSAILGKPK